MTSRRDQIQRRIEAGQAEVERLRAEAERIDAIPDFSEAPVGTVVAIVTTFRSGPRPFVYIAYQASPNRWYVTGQADYMSPDALVEFLTSRTRQVIRVEPIAEINAVNPAAVDLGAFLGAILGDRD